MIPVPSIPDNLHDVINEFSNDDKRLAALSMCFLWRLHAEVSLSLGETAEAGTYIAAANRLHVLAKTAKKKQQKQRPEAEGEAA